MIDLTNPHSGEVRIGDCGECGAPVYIPRVWTGASARPLRRTCVHSNARVTHDGHTNYDRAPIIKRAG